MNWVHDRIMFDGCFTVPSEGRGKGLALLWKTSLNVWVDSFSNHHINAIVHGGSENAWRLTWFYGEPNTSHRSKGWNMLRLLSSKPKLPWCCFGDLMSCLRCKISKEGFLGLII